MVEGGGVINMRGGRMTIRPEIVISLAAVIVSIVSVVCSIVFSSKSNKRTDTKEIEERVKENTRINFKLDNIADSIKDVRKDLSDVRTEIQQHNDKIIKLEESTKSAHHRIDEFVEKCRVCGGKCHE